MFLQEISKSLEESEKIIQEKFSPQINLNDKVFLIGELGAGKTFMVKHLLKRHGMSSEVSSPSFSLINEYRFSKAKIIHVDLYRLNDAEALLELDLANELQKEQLVFVEWGNKFPFLLRWATKKITLEIISEHSRKISLETF